MHSNKCSTEQRFDPETKHSLHYSLYNMRITGRCFSITACTACRHCRQCKILELFAVHAINSRSIIFCFKLKTLRFVQTLVIWDLGYEEWLISVHAAMHLFCVGQYLVHDLMGIRGVARGDKSARHFPKFWTAIIERLNKNCHGLVKPIIY